MYILLVVTDAIFAVPNLQPALAQLDHGAGYGAGHQETTGSNVPERLITAGDPGNQGMGSSAPAQLTSTGNPGNQGAGGSELGSGASENQETGGPEAWKFSSNYHIVDKEYYRIGKLSNNVETTIIEGILDATVQSIKSPEIKDRLKADRPIYLVSKSAREFQGE